MNHSTSIANCEQAISGIGAGESVTEQPIALRDYARGYAAAGWRQCAGSGGTWWLQHEPGALMRLPIFAVGTPEAGELRALHWMRLAPLVSYLLEPDDRHPANGFVYACTNSQYSLEGLDHRVRTNIKRGLREFKIRLISVEEVLAGGVPAYLDTWRRHGHERVSADEFSNSYCATARLPGNKFLAAWKGDELAAFMGITEVDDWVEVRSRFSTNASLNSRPNEALLFTLLRQYLVERKFRTVSAGVSSVDPSANTPGLHRFKVKMGFEAIPVHRVFSFHPLLRPLVSRLGLGLLSRAIRRFPDNRRLGLARHVLGYVLQPPSASLLQLEPDGDRSAEKDS